MRCDKCKEMVWDYLENSLNENERTAVETHLKECLDCAAFMEETRNIMEGLQALPQAELPPTFHARLMERLATEAKVIPLPIKKKGQNRWKQLSLVAAAALVVVAAGSSQGLFDFRGQQKDLVQQITAEQGDGEQMTGGVITATPQVAPEPVVTNDVAPMPSVGEKVTVYEEEKKAAAPPVKESVIPEKVKIQESKVETQAPKIEEDVAANGSDVSMPMSVGYMAAEAPPAEQKEGSTSKLRSAPIAPAEDITPDDSVILTVATEDGVVAAIRKLATTYAGYEVETASTNGITVSIPREQVKGFYEALGKLGEVRTMEENHGETDAEIIEIALEIK